MAEKLDGCCPHSGPLQIRRACDLFHFRDQWKARLAPVPDFGGRGLKVPSSPLPSPDSAVWLPGFPVLRSHLPKAEMGGGPDPSLFNLPSI